jgi:FAD/FMN-containing dehydrogenase
MADNPQDAPSLPLARPLDEADIREFASNVRGQLIRPEDEGYDEARAVFYGGIDRRPALIVRAKDPTDVSRVVALARETGMELAVKSGGHSGAGHSTTEGGILLDLAEMKNLEIDLEGRTAWAQTGLTAGEYTAAVGAHGLATGFGDTGSVGIGGITLGGGVGYLVRKHGLTIDDLLAADVVTADGRLLRADSEAHPDLFWAIRGGGGNFGVATRFHYRLHELDSIVGGMLILPATPEVIASFVAEAEAAPEELSAIANVMTAPPMPFLPPEAHGQLIIMAMLVYAGEEVDEGEALPRDLPARGGRLPPDCGGPHDVLRRRRSPRRRDDRRAPPGLERADGRGPDPGLGWGDGPRARRGHRLRPPQEPDHGERRRALRAPR